MLTSFVDQARVREAIAAGATGYVLKDCGPDELLAAVRSAAAGHAPLDPRVAGALLPSAVPRTRSPAQRPRDSRCCGWPPRAWRTSRSVARWASAERTVKVHLGNVFRRIGVADRTSAALWARENLPAETS